MATDFSRTLSLLRQEKGVSQRKAAGELGISQALLSHYENGIREPGLAFVVKACAYYHVSADFLLGRTLNRDGSIIEAEDVYDSSGEKGSLRGSILATLQKKLVVNTTGVLFELLGKTGDREAITAAGDYLGDALYQLLRQLYRQGGGNEDLILMSTLEDGGVQIELLTVDRDGMFQQVAVMGLSADKFSGCAAVAAGLGADGKRYLVLDGWTGLSGNNLATVLLYFDEESQQMLPAEQISTSELYNASLRNVSTLVSRDLDGDGIVEIPTQPDEAGLLNLSQSRRMDFIVWMDYTSPEPEKSFGLLDEESSCYIELPAEWEGNLMLTDSAEGEEAVELHTVDEGKLVLTMRLVPSSESAAGWTRLGVVASRQMQAKFGPDVVLKDQSYRLSRSLYRLN